MARNLRLNIPEADELFVCDTNAATAQRFLSEARNTGVQVVRTPRELAEKAVSASPPLRLLRHDELLFYR